MAPAIKILASYSTHRYYSVDFFGEDLLVTVTRTPSVIRRWISAAVFFHRLWRSHRPLVVGVGVQWTQPGYFSDSSSDRRYADSPPASYDHPAETLQLCVGKRCIIIQLSYCDRVPLILRRFLTNPETTFVGIWNNQDARKLEQSRHHLQTGELLDIKNYVEDSQGRSLNRCSFEEIVEKCMGYQGVRLDREISWSNWSVCNLSHAQILQATIDAFVCCKLGVQERLWED